MWKSNRRRKKIEGTKNPLQTRTKALEVKERRLKTRSWQRVWEDAADENIGYEAGTWLGHLLHIAPAPCSPETAQRDTAAADRSHRRWDSLHPYNLSQPGMQRAVAALEDQREAVQFSYTSSIGLTLLPFCAGRLLQAPLPAL